MREEFRSVVGYQGRYEVSNKARVVSLSPSYASRTSMRDGFLTPFVVRGYCCVNLYDLNVKIKQVKVHRLVADAFVPGKTHERRFVNHKDGDKQNNNPANLEWVTAKENVRHAIDTGLRNHRGSASTCSKLTEADIPVIRELRRQGCTLVEIGNAFEVFETTIGSIISGRTWTHV